MFSKKKVGDHYSNITDFENIYSNITDFENIKSCSLTYEAWLSSNNLFVDL